MDINKIENRSISSFQQKPEYRHIEYICETKYRMMISGFLWIIFSLNDIKLLYCNND